MPTKRGTFMEGPNSTIYPEGPGRSAAKFLISAARSFLAGRDGPRKVEEHG